MFKTNTHVSSVMNHIQSLRKKFKLPQPVSHQEEEIATTHTETPHTNEIRSMSFIFWSAGVLIIYLGYLLYSSLELVYLVFTGYILSMAIEKMIVWFTKYTNSRGWGIGLAYIIFIAVLLSGVLFMIPFLGGQITDIGSLIYKSITHLQIQLQTQGLESMIEGTTRIPEFIRENILNFVNGQDTGQKILQLLQQNINQIFSVSSTYVQGAGGIAVSIVGSVINAFTQVGFVFTLAILFSIEKENMMKLIHRFDRKHHSNWYAKITQMYEKLGFRLRSQLVLCVFIFTMTAMGLLILTLFGIKLPSTLSLAIIAGLTEMVPYVGPLLGSVPALIVGTLNHGFIGFIGVGVLFFTIQWCENNILIPWIMNKTLGVSSLLIFICMLIGASTLGFIGIVLAVPIAIIISIATEE